MAEGKPWRFQQLGGLGRVLELSGWAAPFGGPRVSSVVRTPVRARTERTFYPGGSNVTRHAFGIHHPNWELKGRFRDRARPPMGGKGFAKAKTEYVHAFLADEQLVRITWGDVLVAQRAYLVEFDPGWEGEDEVEWVLHVEIDQRELGEKPSVLAAISGKSPSDFLAQIRGPLDDIVTPTWSKPQLSGDLFDALDDLFTSVAGAAGQVLSAAEQIRSFKDASFSQLNRLQSTLATLGRASRAFKETFVSIPLDALILQDNADASLELMTSQATVEEQILEMLRQIAEMDRAAELAKAGRTKTSHVARTADTWESISSQYFSRPDRANDIRELNDIAPGQNPVVGVEYLIPK
jgi:hypothetical protein